MALALSSFRNAAFALRPFLRRSLVPASTQCYSFRRYSHDTAGHPAAPFDDQTPSPTSPTSSTSSTSSTSATSSISPKTANTCSKSIASASINGITECAECTLKPHNQQQQLLKQINPKTTTTTTTTTPTTKATTATKAIASADADAVVVVGRGVGRFVGQLSKSRLSTVLRRHFLNTGVREEPAPSRAVSERMRANVGDGVSIPHYLGGHPMLLDCFRTFPPFTGQSRNELTAATETSNMSRKKKLESSRGGRNLRKNYDSLRSRCARDTLFGCTDFTASQTKGSKITENLHRNVNQHQNHHQHLQRDDNDDDDDVDDVDGEELVVELGDGSFNSIGDLIERYGRGVPLNSDLFPFICLPVYPVVPTAAQQKQHQIAQQVHRHQQGEFDVDTELPILIFDSTLRKRKRKMNKHQLKRRRKREKSQRKTRQTSN